jgi:hypothetical protein
MRGDITNPDTVTVEPETPLQVHAEAYRTAPEHALAYAGIVFDEAASRRAKTTDVATLVSVDVVDVTVLLKPSENPARVRIKVFYVVGVIVEVSNSVEILGIISYVLLKGHWVLRTLFRSLQYQFPWPSSFLKK